MSIKIAKEPDVVLTPKEYQRLYRDWIQSQQMTTHPQDFESWVRGKKECEKESDWPFPVVYKDKK